MQKVRAEISLENIRNNAKAFSGLTNTKLCAVVKANAYGHGAEAVTAALCGTVDWFAVALIEEGLAIRVAACGSDILVLTPPTDEQEVYVLAVNGFIATVDSLKTARLASRVCAKYRLRLRVHLKVNTGMNRYGMNVQMLGKTCNFLRNDIFIQVSGLYAHLCECSITRAEKQRLYFVRMLEICKRYYPTVIAHLGGTYGALLGEDYRFDGLRVGLGLYGYLPCGADQKTGVSAETVARMDLKKSMTVYAKAVSRRTYQYGGVGYGEERIPSTKELTVFRVGYADGFLRQRDNGMQDYGLNAGTLCMDACIRYGNGKPNCYVPIMTDAEKVAVEVGTIPYEVLCAATRRAEFIYDEETVFCGR